MGGRGSSSGFSVDKKGKPQNEYGSQYHTVHEFENIKFGEKNPDAKEALMETMTPGRIYVQVGGTDLIRIVLMDGDNKRYKTIELDKRTGKWHVHYGYFHSENSDVVHNDLTEDDNKLLEKVKREWYNHIKGIV